MFSLLIRRDGLIEPPAMSEVDAHCHILPGLDDGAPDDRVALAIARLLLELGVRTVVATPHVISDIYPNSTEEIVDATDRLRRLFVESKIPLRVIPGAEYYVERSFLHQIGRGDVLSFGDERYVLFEMPGTGEPLLLNDIVFSLKSAGYTPLIAHVERYRFLQREFARIEELRRMGARFQVNHPSFHLPKTSRSGELARLMYIKGFADVLGTDIHRASSRDRTMAMTGDKRLFAKLNSR